MQGGNRRSLQHGSGGPFSQSLPLVRSYCLIVLVAGTLLFQGTTLARDTDEAVPVVSPLHVEVVGNRVSVQAHNVTLVDVLREFAQQCHLELVIHGGLDERTTMAYDSLPIPEALKQLLRGRSYALRYIQPVPGDEISEDTRPNTLWVFSDKPEDVLMVQRFKITPGNNPVPGGHPPENSPSLDSLAVELQSGTAADRENAVDLLGDIGGNAALQLLKHALADPEPDVREAAIDAITDIGGNEAALALGAALGDENASLREDTVDALGEIGGETASRLLQQALNDEQKFVRDAAAEHLARLSVPDK